MSMFPLSCQRSYDVGMCFISVVYSEGGRGQLASVKMSLPLHAGSEDRACMTSCVRGRLSVTSACTLGLCFLHLRYTQTYTRKHIYRHAHTRASCTLWRCSAHVGVTHNMCKPWACKCGLRVAYACSARHAHTEQVHQYVSSCRTLGVASWSAKHDARAHARKAQRICRPHAQTQHVHHALRKHGVLHMVPHGATSVLVCMLAIKSWAPCTFTFMRDAVRQLPGIMCAPVMFTWRVCVACVPMPGRLTKRYGQLHGVVCVPSQNLCMKLT